MFEIISAGGWLMLPILTCSVVAMAIVAERLWSLRPGQVSPEGLLEHSIALLRKNTIPAATIRQLQENSPLGRVMAAALANRHRSREAIKTSVEEAGSHVGHQLNRFLNALGTIATITPLLGLLGTVVGMISVFTRITSAGVGNPGELAGGISTALITTAAGLTIAIPSLVMHRYLRGHIDRLLVDMEKQALKLIDVIQIPKDAFDPADAAMAEVAKTDHQSAGRSVAPGNNRSVVGAAQLGYAE